MKLTDFTYDLPGELIAQEPAHPRDSSRLLVLDRAASSLTDSVFSSLPSFLREGDLLVVNDTRVIPARLWGQKPSGGRVEALLLKRLSERSWEALLRASKRFRVGSEVILPGGSSLKVLSVLGEGRYVVELLSEDSPEEAIERLGEMPLPPYIRRASPRAEDKRWYQTLFSSPDKAGSSAAPTAGLHFTGEVREALRTKGISFAQVTLHVGLGTFLPVRADKLSDHKMHSEVYELTEESAGEINRAKEEGRRVVAVGTTSARVLEHCGGSGRVIPSTGETNLFILPGHEFKIVDALLTNFHLPESTLLMLVCAFGGRDLILDAYRHAVKERYRFYSYGDAMLIG
jgi:S-adenosylmethionine:tRNA ribosyltransferase-isomerase